MRVLLVDDDVHTTAAVSMALRCAGCVVDQVDTGEEALELARHYEYDVIFLDLMLPDINGYEVIRQAREAKIDTPILILSGLLRPEAKVRGFGLGADDFVTKPFNSSELLARMRAVVRRTKGLSHPRLRVGEVEINLENKQVTVAKKAVHLTGKEYSILEFLALRRGRVLTKEALLNHLYNGMDEPEAKIIDVFICKIRRKLAAAGLAGFIGTAWGHGYIVGGPALTKPGVPVTVAVREARA